MSTRYWIAPYKHYSGVLGWAPVVYDDVNRATDSVNTIPSPTPTTVGAFALCLVNAVNDTALVADSNIGQPPTGGQLGGMPVQTLDTAFSTWPAADQTLLTNTFTKLGIHSTPKATDTYRDMFLFIAKLNIPSFAASDIDLFALSV